MRLFINLLILFIQCAVTFGLTLFIYMIFALMDYQGGIDGIIGTTIFQPIIGGLICLLTIGVCLIIGLPIRIIKSVNLWWSENYFISILGVFIGLTLLIMSFTAPFKMIVKPIIENQETLKEVPNFTMVIIGWFLVAFSHYTFFHLRTLNSERKRWCLN